MYPFYVHACICVHTMCTRHPRRPLEGIGSTGAGVPWCGFWEPSQGPLEEQQKLRIPEPLLWSLPRFFLIQSNWQMKWNLLTKKASLYKNHSAHPHMGHFSNLLPQGNEWQPSSTSSPATGYLGRFGTSDSLSLGGRHISHKVQHVLGLTVFHFPIPLHLSKENGKIREK